MADFLVEHVDLAVSTRRGYASLIKTVICDPAVGLGERTVSGLLPTELQSWRQQLRLAGVSDANVDAAWRVLRSALSWEVETGRLGSNPALGLRERRTKRSVARRQTGPSSLPGWAQLHELALAIPRWEDRLMMLTLAWTGARLSEICAIDRESLLPTGEILLRHVWVKPKGEPWMTEPLKNGKSRLVPVPQGLWRHLDAHRESWHPPGAGRVHTLFRPEIAYRRGPGIWTDALWRDQVMVPANAAEGLHIRTKDLRALAASSLVDAGATAYEARDLLGHATEATTERHYIRPQRSHDGKAERHGIRNDVRLSARERLDALWEAWVTVNSDPLTDRGGKQSL